MSQDEKKLKTISEYLLKLNTTGLRPEFNVYRGQSNSEWGLKSSATRHLLDTRDDSVLPSIVSRLPPIVFISYHKDILMKARREGFGVEHGQELSDLQLLAELRHFGAPTGLLDFTWNPLVAMWFASEEYKKDGKLMDGKLFSINTNNPGSVYRILGDKENQDISKLFSSQFKTVAPVSIWEPTLRSTARYRMLVMSSVFVIGPQTFEFYGDDNDIVSVVTIKAKDKNDLRKELNCLNINEENLFRDIFGFAQTRTTKSKDTEQSTENGHTDDNKFNQGITYYQQDDFHSAICIFDSLIKSSLIKSNRKKAEYHLYSGITNIRIKNYIQAVKNFDEYFRLEDDSYLAYYFRGVAKSGLGEIEEAIKDYNSAINIQPNYAMTYFDRGFLMYLCSQHEKMILDNEEAMEKMILDNEEAMVKDPYFVQSYYNCAYANYMLGKYGKAIEHFTTVLQFDHKNSITYFGRAGAYYRLGKYEHAVQDFRHAIELEPEYTEAYYSRASAYYMLEKYKEALQDFTRAIELKQEYAEAYFGRASGKLHA